VNLDSAAKLLGKLGCEKISPRRNGWLQSTCPFAPFTATHKNQRDNHPSFGVGPLRRGKGATQSDRDELIFGYNCYTCRIAGLLKWLVVRMERVSGRDYSSLYRYVQTDKTMEGIKFDNSLPSVTLRKLPPPPPPLTEESLLKFKQISLVPLKYLLGRGLVTSSIQKWELRWDPVSLRIVLPIRDGTGKLVGYSRRSISDPRLDGISDPELPKFLHCYGFKRDCYLYGEHLTGNSRVAYLTEGFFDAIYLHQCGYVGALALLGSYVSHIQVGKLVKQFDKVFIIGDGDKAGRKMTDEIFVRLSTAVDCKRVYMPEGKDPDELSVEDLRQLLGPPETEVVEDLQRLLRQ